MTCDCRPTPIGDPVRAARCCASFGMLNAMKRPLARSQISKDPAAQPDRGAFGLGKTLSPRLARLRDPVRAGRWLANAERAR
jgi:hypothetical protein